MSRCDIHTVSLLWQPGKQLRLDCGEIGLAELRRAGSFNRAAEIEREQLRAVADAERGDAERKHVGIDVRRAVGVHRRRAAAQDQRMRIARAHLRGRDAVADELGVHAAFADASRDQLCVLAAEIHDEHRPFLGGAIGKRQNLSGDSSAPLS